MLDIIHRSGFPLDQAQRIQGETALENANELEARNYAMRPFMDRPDSGDYLHVMRWIAGCRYHFETSTNMSRLDVLEAARQYCYHESPYGKRYAVHKLGLNRDHLHMPEFKIEHEAAFHRYVESKRKAGISQHQGFSYREEGEVEIC